MLMLASAGVVMGDNVQNDVVVDETDTILVGESAAVAYRLIANNAPNGDVNGCNVTDSNPAHLTVSAPAGVTASPSSVQITDCGNDGAQLVTFSSSTAGEYQITHTISGGLAGSLYQNQADWTLKVLQPMTFQINQAPAVHEITGLPAGAVPVGTTVQGCAAYTDEATDTHTAWFNWNTDSWNGSAELQTSASIAGSGASACASFTYTTAGVYSVQATVTDNHGASGSSPVHDFVVVYDASAGFITGGGWIDSPAGSYAADPGMTGKATFGFVSRYAKGKTVPSGNTEFRFSAAQFSFKSTDYEWLVISGARGQYKGTGTVNGAGGYGFLLSAIDGQVNGGGGIDKFRIKIWDSAGQIVFDNQSGAQDDAAPSTAISGGNIVIHSK
jgi:hypothetical protein